MRHLAGLVTAVVLAAAPALAEAPASSLLPMPRPQLGAAPMALGAQAQAIIAASASLSVLAPASAPRPLPRPGTAPLAVAAPVAGVVAAGAAVGLTGNSRPAPRPALPPEIAPEAVEPVAAVRVLPGKSAVVGRKGSVCGVNGIKGETLAPITSRVRGCGITDPVRITSVDGVALSTPATVDCDTARALNDWVRGALKPAFGSKEVVRLQVAASYACRPRNNVKGAKISEHGRGKAIDIAAIVLANGSSVSVAEDWRNRAGKPMVKAYHGACGTFGTTLSPDADRYHRDHMHFDTASQRGGPYCR